MKIHIDGVNFSSTSGPNGFGQRLARKFFEIGHEVVIDSGINADISLVFIERSGRSLAKRVVQRLDGIWFKPDEFNDKNIKIKALYETADRIIWQSQFDHSMTTKWWGERQGVIIKNGIDVGQVEVTNQNLLGLRQQFKKIFVCSANWHPQKRLRSNIEFFFEQLKIEPNSCLLILGSNPDVRVAHPKVFYTGSISEDLCLQVYKIADWMIHLAWLDHCPNVVVHALSQGCPVVCPSDGGTKELIGSFGVILQEEKPYDFSLTDYTNPPQIKVSDVILPQRSELPQSPDMGMNYVVKHYISLFEEIV